MHKIVKLITLTLVLVLANPIHAQLLYKISSKKSNHVSYLLATSTLVESPFLDSIPEVFKAYNQSLTIICELYKNDKVASSELNNAKNLYMKSSLKELLSKEQFEWADSIFQQETSLSLLSMNRFKPFMTSQMFAFSIQNKLFPLSSNDVIDIQSFFPYMASIDEKQIIGLSSTEEILKQNEKNRTIAQQLEVFLHLLNSKDAIQHFYVDQKKAYMSQNLNTIYSGYSQSSLKYFQLQTKREDLILNWTDSIINEINRTPCFIVLNAIYLTGEDGLIQQLKNRNIKVNPIK
ncbi:TraB/GumN family protein [Gammaproteobacteria bacterium]|nr:TraB/GumN family protein [Gammaproteobacteria bacterium]